MRVRGEAVPPGDEEDCTRDRGASLVEYAALIAVAALLLGAIYAAVEVTQLDAKVRKALCEILRISDKCDVGGDGTGKPGDQGQKKPNFLPVYCDARIDQDSASVGINWDWTFIHLHTGGNVSLVKERLANGEVWVTVAAGAHGGVGAGLGENVEVGGDASVNVGSTYQFQSNEEADKWIQALKDGEAVGDGQKKSGGYNPYGGGYQFDDDKPSVPKPHKVIQAVDTGLDFHAKAKTPDVPLGKHVNFGGGIEGSFGEHMVYEDWDLQDPKSGRKPNGEYQNYKNYSYTWKMTGEYQTKYGAGVENKNGNGVGVEGGSKQKWSSAVRYMYNTDGTLANIRWITTYERGFHGSVNGKGGDNKAGVGGEKSNEVTRMTQVNFDTPEKRAIGEKWIRDNGGGGIPPKAILDSITGDKPAVTENPHDSDDPNNPKTLDQLMFNEGKSWEWDSDNTNIVDNLWNGPLVDVTVSHLTKSTKSAEYLGPPQGDHRENVDFPQCKDGQEPASHQYDLDGY